MSHVFFAMFDQRFINEFARIWIFYLHIYYSHFLKNLMRWKKTNIRLEIRILSDLRPNERTTRSRSLKGSLCWYFLICLKNSVRFFLWLHEKVLRVSPKTTDVWRLKNTYQFGTVLYKLELGLYAELLVISLCYTTSYYWNIL